MRIGASTLAVATVAASAVLTVAAYAPAAEDTRSSGESLLALVDLAAQRVQIADAVAAAKWGTDSPINDPVREQAVLRSAATKSRNSPLTQQFRSRSLPTRLRPIKPPNTSCPHIGAPTPTGYPAREQI